MKRLRLIENKQERFLASLSTLTLVVLLPDGRKETVTGRFDGCRIPISKIPCDYRRFSIRHGDDMSEPDTLENNVWVNHFGDFVCKDADALADIISSTPDKSLEIVEWSFGLSA